MLGLLTLFVKYFIVVFYMTSFCFFPAGDTDSDSSSDGSGIWPQYGIRIVTRSRFDFDDEGVKPELGIRIVERAKPSVGPKLYVICGMTGSGKDTVFESAIRILQKEKVALSRIKQSTTRARREGEPKDAYNFLNEEDFLSQQNNKLFLEVMNFGGYFYATPRLPVVLVCNADSSKYLIIGIQGVVDFYSAISNLSSEGSDTEESLLNRIRFIHVRCAESDDDLLQESMKRIKNRGKDSPDLLQIREENNAKDVALIQSDKFKFIHKEIFNLNGCDARASQELAAYILDQENQF